MTFRDGVCNRCCGALHLGECADVVALQAEIERLTAPPHGTCPTCGSDCNERDELIKAEREIERLRKGHERYETARRMNPRLWADAWELNVKTGKPFDEIIDEWKPHFYRQG